MESLIQAWAECVKVICTFKGTRLATSNKVLTKHVFIKVERWGNMQGGICHILGQVMQPAISVYYIKNENL